MLKSLDQPSVLETTHYVGSKTYAYRTMASKITEMDGTVIHTASAIEVPKDWSQTACDILSQKYFRKAGVPDKVKVVPEKGIFPDFRRSVPTVDAIFGSETSAHKVFIRLAGCWTYWGIKKKYFTTKEEASSFFNNCYDALYNQYASPNSPQWFNTGLYWAYGITSDISSYSLYHLENNKPVHSTVGYEHSAVHACFIQSVEDHLLGNGGIMDLFVREAGVFKYGSGSGSNYSKVRGLGESLAGGGTSSGLMSWLKIGDTSAGAIKSGGTCLTGATPVYTQKGFFPVESLINKTFLVLSMNVRTGKVTPKKATAFYSGKKEAVRVTTDKGVFEVSYDHPMLTKSGKYVEAAKLKVNQRLSQREVYINRDGYPTFQKYGYYEKHHGERSMSLLHREVAKKFIGPVKGKIVHHDNEDKLNASIKNLEIFESQSDHASHHMSDPNRRKLQAKIGRKVAKRLVKEGRHPFQIYDMGKLGAENGMHGDSDFWKDKDRVKAYKRKQSKAMSRLEHNGKSVAANNGSVSARRKMLDKSYELLDAGYDIRTLEKYFHAKIDSGIFKDANLRDTPKQLDVTREKVERQFGSYSAFYKELAKHNHKVISIEKIGKRPVYDVQVECGSREDRSSKDNHNFAIGDLSYAPASHDGYVTFVHNTRRAARMVTLDMDHPEIEKYIGWKVEEENKVAALITGSRLNKTLANNIVHAEDSDVFDHAVAAAYEAGVPTGLIQRAVQANSYGYELDLAEFDSHWEGEGYQSVSGQNANNSISVPDEFMEALENRGPWNLTARTTGETIKTVEAEYLWKKAMTAAWVSADPGVHYSGTMNKWNTCLNDERIVATNPCSEYIFLDDTACFTGDTLVWTMDGPVRFDVLAKSGKTVPVLTELHDGTLAYRDMVRPRKTKRDAELVEVTFKARGAKGRKNSYTTVRCTPDHIFFLRDGTSKKAKNLLPDDRIESAYRYTSDKYVTINGSSEGMIREHILTAEYKYGERPDPTLHHVHHRDEDGHNNAQNNIIVKTIEKHIGDHSKAWFKNATTEQKILRSKRISKAHTGKVLSKEHRAKLSASHKGIRQSEEVVAKRAAANTGKKRSPEQIIRLKQGLAKRRSEGTYTTVAGRIWITNDVDNQRIEADSKIPRGWRRGRASWKEKVESGPTNHSVVSVKRLRTKQDVYCGTVGDTGRFFISLGNNHAEGVLVKNCNLASLNLVTIMNKSKWNFQVFAGELRFFSRLFQTVLDISIEMAQFVSEPIARKTAEYRTTGLGYANLGSLIMRMGHAYGDKASKSLTGYITAIMTGEAYLTSADIADGLGAFPAFKRNESSFMNVMRMHSDHVNRIPDEYQGVFLYDARDVWNQVTERTQFRNAFTTCIAPTGTIGLVMDCDTTGIEPDFSLIKSKKLAGGGYMRLLNSAVPQALKQLGYDEAEIKEVEAYIFGHNSFSAVSDIEMITEIDLLAYVSKPDLNAIYRDIPKMYTLHQVIEAIGKIANADLSFMLKDPEIVNNTTRYVFGHGSVDGCNVLEDDDLMVFACANAPEGSKIVISPEDHLGIVAEAQPFVSGGISKTINMPASATVSDIDDIYRKAYYSGVKCVSVYRDGSKLSQPLMANLVQKIERILKETSTEPVSTAKIEQAVATIIHKGERRKLPGKRRGYTQKMTLGGNRIYLRTGEYPDGQIGEIFLDMNKEGAALRALMNNFSIAVSIGLQYGVPLDEFVDAFTGTKFDPAGPVIGHDNIRNSSSILDLIFRDLAFNYLNRDDLVHIKPERGSAVAEIMSTADVTFVKVKSIEETGYSRETASVKMASSGPLYTGEACPECKNFTMKRSGSCFVCDSCGATTGCS